MTILISLNDARKKLNELEGSAEYNKGVTDAFNALFDLQSIEVESKHGRWIKGNKVYPELPNDGDYYWYCSECGSQDQHNIDVEVPFCWHCGAKMDEVRE